MLKEWQNIPFELIYRIIFTDTIHFKVKKDTTIVSKAAYAVIGVNLLLGIWIGSAESLKC